MRSSAADERQVGPSPEQPSERLLRVGIVLSADHGLVAGAMELVIDRAPSLQLVTIRTDRDGRPLRGTALDADVVIVDRVAIVAQVRESAPDVRVIVLTGTSDPDDVLASIRAGASACVDASMSPSMLVEIAERVCAGEVVFEPNILVELLQRQSAHTISAPIRTAKLSDRELEVLTALARGASTAEAAEEFGISLNTIRTHLKNILVKMGARSKLEAVVIALREGRISLDLPES
jgi:DNA-binding NarL/FixJ family response regulator